MTNIFNDMPPVTMPTRTVVAVPQATTTVQTAIPAAPATPGTDTVEISKEKPKKQGPIKKLKNFIANIKKTCATAGEYVKGGTKGITSGVVAGSVIYTAGQIAKKFAKEGSKLAKVPNKAFAIVAGVGLFAANIWTASLNATEKRSDIEHRWTGHNN